jgi:succinate-semialdehyde dehydrogenase/glutarate-semialdehyde dehydrogenase
MDQIACASARQVDRLGGGLFASQPLADVFFVPTIIEGITPAMSINNEETFGPVAPLIRFESEAEGVAKADASGLGVRATQ